MMKSKNKLFLGGSSPLSQMAKIVFKSTMVGENFDPFVTSYWENDGGKERKELFLCERWY